MTPRHRPRPLLRLLGTGLAILGTPALATGCGGSSSSDAAPSSDLPASEQPYLPTATPSDPVTLADPPADFSRVDGDGFAISAPGEFQQQRLTSSNGEPMLVLEAPSSVDAVPQRVAVIRDVDPQQSAAEQSFALEAAKGAGGPDARVERSSIAVPGAREAFLTTWQEVRPSAGAANVTVTYWQLMAQVDDHLILNVVALAPSQEFATSEVSTILRSFQVQGSSA